MTNHYDVIIIGGGWSGLATAIHLVKHNKKVLVLESSRQPGGRALSVAFHQHTVDNGTHIMIGAYRETLQLLTTIGLQQTELFERHPFSLTLRRLNGRKISLPASGFPSPLHLLMSFLDARGLTFKDKWRALRMGMALSRRGYKLTQDISVAELLDRHQQSAQLVSFIWEPLCLAIMNTPLHEASAEIFLNVFNDVFNQTRHDTDFLFFKKNLSSILPEPAMNYLAQHHAEVKLSHRVTQLIPRADYHEVRTDRETFTAPHIVVATPPYITQRLLQSITTLRHLTKQLDSFEYQPICTVYLQYPKNIMLPQPMTGLLGGTGQWLFDHAISGQAGLMSVVISSSGKHMQWDNPTLETTIADELATLYPHWPKPTDTFTIREKRATFSATVNINQNRPGNRTPIQGLWLTGDYVATGYPATLESALRSSVQCAQAILSE